VTAQSTPGVGSRFTLILPLGDHRPGATYVKH
jgi:signal transduction histidine kinase